MTTKNKCAIPALPELRTHEATIAGNTYIFTELNGLQRVTVDIESGIVEATEEDRQKAAVMWYDFKCYYVAMALESGTGKTWKELLPNVRAQRMEDLLEMYDAAQIANHGAEEGGDPKKESA